jgi:hypothetical protein
VGHLRLDWESATFSAKVIAEDGEAKITHQAAFTDLLVR